MKEKDWVMHSVATTMKGFTAGLCCCMCVDNLNPPTLTGPTGGNQIFKTPKHNVQHIVLSLALCFAPFCYFFMQCLPDSVLVLAPESVQHSVLHSLSGLQFPAPSTKIRIQDHNFQCAMWKVLFILLSCMTLILVFIIFT